MTSRGCPHSCAFCAKISKEFRARSAEDVAQEMKDINIIFGYDAFMIFDDVFIVNKKRLTRIRELIEKENYTIRCFGRADLLDDYVCKELSRMGVVEVGIGIESGSAEILKSVMKQTNPDVNGQAIINLRNHGIRSKAFLIVGLPGESEQTIEETQRWLDRYKPDDMDFSILSPMPGSEIFSDPEHWGIKYSYNGLPLWYKGRPGEYESSVSTNLLSAEQIVSVRNRLEKQYKDPSHLI
jgi:radical SAM superfamily enzyme YgiQ (UPF0313 family)